MTTRLRWLDLLRSLAILGMVVFHAAFDLQTYYEWPIGVFDGWWFVFGRSVGYLFLAVAGISAGFWATSTDAAAKGWRRGWILLSAAMLVSLATAIVDEPTWVRFGILHLMAVAALLLPHLRRLHPAVIAALGVACLLGGWLVADLRVETSLLVPLGLKPVGFRTLDYFPVLPNLGVILLGFAAGIPIAKRAWSAAQPSRFLDMLAVPGRYSLWIYLLHQPVILAILWFVLRPR